jgi:lipopolysaccharide transport system ATP-binding protein
MPQTVIKIENLSKLYRLGQVGTGTLSHDLNRWWRMNILRQPDPYTKIGQVNSLSNNKQLTTDNDLVWALKDINFEVKQGEVLGIIGKNGAGKSTLLKILSKVTSPTTGSIKAKGRIASLLEVGTGFNPEMTGRENIYMNGTIMGMRKWEIDRKFDEIVDFSGVEKYIDTPVKRYSSGMTVRLGFAIAAHLEPEILVVDEVLAVGDAEFQKKALGKMQEVSQGQGRTVLFVSHNMTAVNSLCQHGIYLKTGLIHYSGSIQNTINKYLTEETAIKTKVLWDTNNWPGDEIASLLTARVIDESFNDLVKVDISQKIGIEYTYEVKVEGASRIPNIHVRTAKGDIVFISGESDDNKFKQKGTFKSVMWIPGNLLNVETYIVGIALSTMSPVKVHFWEQSALIFEISENFNNRQTGYNQTIPGIIRPLLNWETSKL